MTPTFIAKLGLVTQKIDVGVQKIDDSPLVTQEMVLVDFSVQDKLGKVQFFEETFLLVDTSMELILGILFPTFSNANLQFVEKELKKRNYTTAEILPITKRVELINKKEFAAVALEENAKTFVVYVPTLSAAPTMQVHLLRQAQVGLSLADEALAKVPPKYFNYADGFSFDFIMELPENTGMNEHTIELVKGKEPSYGPIYSLGPIELKTLKTYIKTYLKTRFIQPSKSPVSALILFNQKPDRNLCLCINYQGLNNLTIKISTFCP